MRAQDPGDSAKIEGPNRKGFTAPMHRLRPTLIPLAILALALTACGSTSGTPASASAGPSMSARPSESSSPPAMAKHVRVCEVGADGTRYEVIWPDGWSLDADGNLHDPSGAMVAGLGDEITVGGRVADDVASICQIGPIFEAFEVTPGS